MASLKAVISATFGSLTLAHESALSTMIMGRIECRNQMETGGEAEEATESEGVASRPHPCKNKAKEPSGVKQVLTTTPPLPA